MSEIYIEEVLDIYLTKTYLIFIQLIIKTISLHNYEKEREKRRQKALYKTQSSLSPTSGILGDYSYFL